MMKKKLQLQTVIHLKNDLSRDVVELQKDIIKYNNTDIEVEALFETQEKKADQLLIVKEAIQKANQKKHADGKTNNYYIYRLSNLNATRVMLEDLLQGYDKETSQLSKEDLENNLEEVLTEIETISSLLKTFNRDNLVAIEVDKDLNLLNE